MIFNQAGFIDAFLLEFLPTRHFYSPEIFNMVLFWQ